MSGPINLDELLVEFGSEIGLKKPLARDFKLHELVKCIAGKELLDQGGCIMVDTTLS